MAKLEIGKQIGTCTLTKFFTNHVFEMFWFISKTWLVKKTS